MLPPSLSQRFVADKRIHQAKDLIQAALDEHRQKITGVRDADPELVVSYEATLEEFARLRGGGLYYPYLSSGLGNGPYVELCDGSVKLDMIGGIGVHGLGHSHPRLVEVGVDAALTDTVMQGNLQQHATSVDISRLLLQTANAHGAHLDHVFLTTSGAMANENALKMAFQKHAPANRVLAFRECFSGRTLGLSQITDKAKYRDGLPDTISVDYLPFFESEAPQHSTEKALGVLQRHLSRYPGKHAAMVFELVQGEGGYYPGDRDFFIALLKVLREHQVAAIFDEVQSFGRTTKPFAFQHYGLEEFADIVTVGKITQVCATLFSDDYRPRPGLISQTFTGSSWSMLACQVVIEELLAHGNFGENGLNQQIHARFSERLTAFADKNPDRLRGPFGIGGMLAFTPLGGKPADATRTCKALYEAGLIGFVAGANPARVRFLPPLAIIELDHIDTACDIIETTMLNLELEG